MRALAFAAAPILLIALGSGLFLRMDRTDLIGLVFDIFFLQSVFVVNLIVLVYRIVAIVDAYRVAEYLNAHEAGGTGRLGPGRIVRNPLSIAGLLAVILVMAGAHVVVARYDMLALDVLDERLHLHRRRPGPVCATTAERQPRTRRRRRRPTPSDERPRRPTRPRRRARRPRSPPPSRRSTARPSPRSRSRRGTARSG